MNKKNTDEEIIRDLMFSYGMSRQEALEGIKRGKEEDRRIYLDLDDEGDDEGNRYVYMNKKSTDEEIIRDLMFSYGMNRQEALEGIRRR